MASRVNVSEDRDATAGAPNQSAAIPPVRKRAQFHLLKVAQLDRLTDDAVAITFAVPEQLREEFRFRPGQHLSLRLTVAGDDVRRNYSICAPNTNDTLRIGVKRLPGGVFSNYALDRLQVGDSIEVLRPTGQFIAELGSRERRHYGAIAAGSGITPILSILWTALEIEPHSRATLINVNRTSGSIMFLEDLEDLKNRFADRFQMVHVLSRERQEADLLSGRLDAERLDAILDRLVRTDDVDGWFLCGPLALIETARTVLLARGADPGKVHRELFHAEDTPPRRPLTDTEPEQTGRSVTVVLDGRSTSFLLPPNTEPILDGALRLRGDAPYACKNGVCGTCRAKLVNGTVDMAQNYALEQDELDHGYVLACQSYPTSDDVILDFDV
jgi:ring-1,2-phenylacetyl-CoA epoxidase subunit PaaE